MSNIRNSDGTIRAAESLFYNPQARLDHVSPADIRLLGDRVMIEDLPPDEKDGSLFLPETAQGRGLGKNESLRIGRVVAIGPGDKYWERQVNRPKRPTIVKCTSWAGRPEGWRFPMAVRVGDKVLYHRRREGEWKIGGKLYSLVHEEQAILAVLA